jgi:hypothetical protein
MSIVDWKLIQLRYEAGQTPYAISQSLGGKPTKQGIAAKAKRDGWQRQPNALTVAEALPIVERARALAGPTKCTADRVAFVLELLGKGSTLALAARAAGISTKTLKRWQQDDPLFAEQCRQARAGKLADWIASIDRAAQTDWKAAKELLTQADDVDGFSRADTHGGITVVLNIDRDGKEPTIIQGN